MADVPPWPALESGRLVHLPEAASTNSEAQRLADEGAPSGTWVLADRQTAGRGRSGREWQSEPGNLTASLIVRDVFPLDKAYQLALVSGVAVHAAIGRAVTLESPHSLELKWPNDILLGRAKLGGILVESSVTRRAEGALAVVGIGLNLARHPVLEDRPATSLSAHGATIAALKMLAFLDESMQEWLRLWSSGEGFGRVRTEWLARSLPEGVRIKVHSGQGLKEGLKTGTFAGLDHDGALLIRDAAGSIETVSFGDVALLP